MVALPARHVENKDAIVSGLMDADAGEVEHPVGSPDWKVATRECAISTRNVMLRHP